MLPPWWRAHVGSPHRGRWARKYRRLFLMISSKETCNRKKKIKICHMGSFLVGETKSTEFRIYFTIGFCKEHYRAVEYRAFADWNLLLWAWVFSLSPTVRQYSLRNEMIYIQSQSSLWNCLFEWSTGAQKHQLHCASRDTRKITRTKTNFSFDRAWW